MDRINLRKESSNRVSNVAPKYDTEPASFRVLRRETVFRASEVVYANERGVALPFLQNRLALTDTPRYGGTVQSDPLCEITPPSRSRATRGSAESTSRLLSLRFGGMDRSLMHAADSVATRTLSA
ncbi:predicted protein [Coccidioides posadasii str. Silveira]|uniref:Predicted protein n=2 Tax=Coccidioides posadasii TaxID=199306 RepID=E9DC77_COCPS|nr:predicted protein [Coccidioides posadasii str. Silveira]KMM69113.1 hypothetical protein CPAG_05435 [Coccidioides posadasii RMSCC 3488]